MKNKGWDRLILSEPNYEHLVAELHNNDQFLLQLDREQGPDAICIAFPDRADNLGSRVPLTEFLEQLKATVDDLKR